MNVGAGRRRRRRCRRRRRHGGSVNDVIRMATARWWRRSFGHQIQIFQPIIHRDAVAVNDLEARRYPSTVSLPAHNSRNGKMK